MLPRSQGLCVAQRAQREETAEDRLPLLILIGMIASTALIIDPRATSDLLVKSSWLLLCTAGLLFYCALGRTKNRPIWLSVVRRPLGSIGLALLALLMAAALSGIGAWSALRVARSWAFLGAAVGVFALARRIEWTDTAWQLLSSMLLATGAAISICGLLQVVGAVPTAPGVQGAGRMTSTLGNVNYVAEYAAVLTPVAITYVCRQYGSRRVLGILCLMLFVAVLIVAGSRGAWLGAGGSAVFLLLARLRARPGRVRSRLVHRHNRSLSAVLLGAGVLTISLLLTVGILLLPHVSSPDAATPYDQALWLRHANARIAWEMLWSHPATGVGLGHFELRFLEFKRDLLSSPATRDLLSFYVPYSVYAHSELLQWMAETGLVGFTAIVWLLIALGRGLIRSDTLPRSERLRVLASYSAIVAMLLVSLVSFPLHRPASALLAILFLAAIDGQTNEIPRVPSQRSRRNRRRWGRILARVFAIGLSIGLAIAVHRDYRSDLLLQRGRDALAQLDASAAVSLLDRGRRLAWDPGPIEQELGLAWLQLGDAGRAAMYLTHSLRTRKTEDALLYLAQAYAELGDFPAAHAAVAQLLATEPHPSRKVPAYLLRAELFSRDGAYEESLAQLEHVIQQGSPLLRTQAGLLAGHVLGQLGRLDEAVVAFHQALDEGADAYRQRIVERDALLANASIPVPELLELEEEIVWLEDAMDTAEAELNRLKAESARGEDNGESSRDPE